MELLGWPHIARAAVFDEWIVNTDRHEQNLPPRYGKEKFVLIDHGMAFHGPGWTVESLIPILRAPSSGNQLANLIAESSGEFADRLKNETLANALHFARNLNLTEKFLDLNFADLDRDCGLDLGTTEHVVRLLDERRKRLTEFMMRHVTMGQMFSQ